MEDDLPDSFLTRQCETEASCKQQGNMVEVKNETQEIKRYSIKTFSS